ncbi:MAG: hypothetical protein ACREU2_13750 [Steroidobacteraceae bacterium]
MKISLALSGTLLAVTLGISGAAWAQFGPPPHPTGPPPPAQKAAPIDLTGYWVSIITEDWRWRMLTAPKGDYQSVPLNAAGIKLANTFSPAAYASGQIDCRAYGAAGLMRMPTRVHISWVNDNELQLQSDWGEQTRMIYFNKSDMPSAAPSLQGSSLAHWEFPVPIPNGMGFGPRRGPKPPGGDLAVMTDNLAPGWLRRNGVPYGTHTRLLEHYQTFQDPTGKTWFDVTTQVDDPEYLNVPFITSSDFRKEPDGSKWAPHPCN